MSGTNVSELQYFQFQKAQDYPIYISCIPAQFGEALVKLLKDCHFTQLEKKEILDMKEKLKKANARVLKLELANIKVLAQIGTYRESDKFGLESVTNKLGHQVYRYRGRAMLVYSYATVEWNMGVLDNFGADSEAIHDKIIINRFLSWALAPLGVVGFFGLGIDSGIVIMNQTEASGEVIWIDIFKEKIITSLEEKKLSSNKTIVRLDSTVKGQNLKMTRSELLSFLMVHNIFLSAQGPSTPVRQVLQALSKICQGLVHPKESLRVSTNKNQPKVKRPDVLKDKM